MRILVAVSGAAVACGASTRKATAAPRTVANGRMERLYGNLACIRPVTWVTLFRGRMSRPRIGEHERDGPGLAEVRSQLPQAERTTRLTPSFATTTTETPPRPRSATL